MQISHIATVMLLSAVCHTALAVDPPPTAAELRDWSTADECVRAGKRAGFDYPRTVDRAIAGDVASLATLFRFTDSGWCDGAAGEGNAAILSGLLQHLGDRRFASVLRAQKKDVRKAVFNEVSAFPGWTPKKFPLTNALAPR